MARKVFRYRFPYLLALGWALPVAWYGCDSSSSSTAGGTTSGTGGGSATGSPTDGGPSSCDGGVGLAITSVVGTIGHGESLTVHGCGFGERSLSAGSFYESWDWGHDGDPVTNLDSPWSTAGADDDPARFSEESPRGAHTGSHLKVILPDPISGTELNDIVYRGGFQVLPGDRVYVSNFFWSTYGGAREFGNECPQQWKLMNWLTHGPQPLTGPNTGFTWNAAGVDGPPDGDPQIWVNQRCESGTAGDTVIRWGVQPPERTWWQVEIEYLVATAEGAEDGYLRVWFDGQLAGEKPTSSWCGIDLSPRVETDGFVYSLFVLRNYIPWPGCDTQEDIIRHDDTVLQVGSWARVALGDADTWDDCTVRDYQPVTSWSDTTITLDLNQGAFQSGQTAWLYVIDDAGARSPGHVVTFP